MKKLLSKFAEKLTGKGSFSSLLRGSSVVLLIQVLGKAVGYFDQVVLARWMGSAEYGLYVYIISFASLSSTLPQLGQRDAVVRFIPEYKIKKEPGRLKGVVQGALGMVFLSTVSLSILGTGIAYFLYSQGRVESLAVVLIGIWLMPLIGLVQLCMSIMQGFRRMVTAVAPQVLLRPLLILLGVAIIYFTREGNQYLNSMDVLWVTLTAFTAMLLYLLWMIRNEVQKATGNVRPIFEFRKILRVSIPLLLAAGFTNILVQSDLVMIGLIRGAEEVGLYNAAVRSAAIIGFILTSVAATAAPMISAAYAEGDPKKLQRIISKSNQIVLVPSLAIVIGVVILSKPILANFGPEFVSMRPVLIILAIGQFIKATCGPIGLLLDLTGFQDDSARIRATTAILNILLNILGIYTIGAMGAAIATVTSMVVEKSYTDYLVNQRIGISPSWLSTLRNRIFTIRRS